jgi:hypothetical protein
LANGGRTWWAHFEFTRINTAPIFLPKKMEDLREAAGTWAKHYAAFKGLNGAVMSIAMARRRVFRLSPK